ncbi:uncharacterized protein LOC116431726 [Nomia melanderi]|uniref:uncharacterized protein LOC116431726 n=1 Tax=Nomia melanderi TaxID=2448451 RepID=UPI003FCC9A2C
MDIFLDNRGVKNNRKRELYLFNSSITSFENIIFTKRNIQTLVIICQRNISSFYAISELTQIQELWIVDCGLKVIQLFLFSLKQILQHNVLFHKQLSEYLKSVKDNYKEYKNIMLYFKNKLYVTKHKQTYLKEKTHDESLNISLKMELNKQQFMEKKKMAMIQSKILQQQLIYNINYWGNINFVEYNTNPKNAVTQLCKQFLEESLCSIIKNDIGITGLTLYKVTEVNNKEMDQLNLWNDTIKLNEYNMILKIVTSPGVTDIQAWPFDFFKTGLFSNVPICLSEKYISIFNIYLGISFNL